MHALNPAPRCALGICFGTLVVLLPALARGAPTASGPVDWTRVAAELTGGLDGQPQGRVVAASPVPADARISSHYGRRPGRTTGRPTFHAGVDFAAAPGTPVFAARAGQVTHVARNVRHRRTRFGGYGNAVVVHHVDLDEWSFYAHLRDTTVEEGDYIAAGQRVGHIGNTSNGRFPGMGAHLHFEVRERRPDGREPFPGPYGRHNADPEQWLASYGIVYGDGGLLQPEPVLPVAVHQSLAARHLNALDVPPSQAPYLSVGRLSTDACAQAVLASTPSPDPWCELSAALACLVPLREVPPEPTVL